MRICMVTHYCRPHVGGIETISFEEAKRLARQGHQVTLLSSRTAGEPPEECLEGVRIRRVRAFNLLEQWLGVPYPLFGLGFYQALDEELSAADVCIVHGFAFLSSLLAAWICRRKGISYIVIQHNTFVRYPNPLLNMVQRLNDLIVGRYTLSHAAYVFAVSEQTRQYTASLVRRKIEVLPNAVDRARFFPSRHVTPIRRNLGLPENKIIALTVRRLFFKNGLSTLLETARLLRQDTRLHFVVVGAGPERRPLERYLRKYSLANCSIVGFVPDPILPQYYQAADMFIFPSHTGEGSGLVILEAYASGLPVISTSGGGQTEIVRDGDTGFVIAPKSPEQLAERIGYWLKNSNVLFQMNANARRYIEQNQGWGVHISRLERICFEVREAPQRIKQTRALEDCGIGKV